jgi:hypothetical protein
MRTAFSRVFRRADLSRSDRWIDRTAKLATILQGRIAVVSAALAIASFVTALRSCDHRAAVSATLASNGSGQVPKHVNPCSPGNVEIISPGDGERVGENPIVRGRIGGACGWVHLAVESGGNVYPQGEAIRTQPDGSFASRINIGALDVGVNEAYIIKAYGTGDRVLFSDLPHADASVGHIVVRRQ